MQNMQQVRTCSLLISDHHYLKLSSVFHPAPKQELSTSYVLPINVL